MPLALKNRASTVSSAPAMIFLHLVTYFTVGPKEARAWTITHGHQGAGRGRRHPHGFREGLSSVPKPLAMRITLKNNGEAGATEAGKFRLEGKEYVVTGWRCHAFPFRELSSLGEHFRNV